MISDVPHVLRAPVGQHAPSQSAIHNSTQFASAIPVLYKARRGTRFVEAEALLEQSVGPRGAARIAENRTGQPPAALSIEDVEALPAAVQKKGTH